MLGHYVEVKVEDQGFRGIQNFNFEKKSRGSRDSFFGRSEGFFSYLEVKFKEILSGHNKNTKTWVIGTISW